MTTQITEPARTSAAAAALDSTPARPGLRRRIGFRQTMANALTLAWRNVMQLKHSPEKLMDVTLIDRKSVV